MEIKRCTYKDFFRIKDFLALIFPQDNPKYYTGFLYNDQFFNPDRVFYIEDQKQIVSALWSIPRIFRDEDAFIFSAGIANVGTHPNYRKRGYASALMNYAISLAHSEEAKFVVLVTEIPRYYKRYGFFDLGKYYSVVDYEENDRFPRVSVKVAALEDVAEASNYMYRNANLIAPLRNYSILKSSVAWNSYSSHFIFKDEAAKWYELSVSNGLKIFIYAVGKEDHYEIFDIVFDPESNIEGIILMLKGLSFLMKMPLKIYSHPLIFDKLNLDYRKDHETVMSLEIKTTDMDRLYLPVSDYF